MRLIDAPCGLLKYKNILFLKTEYFTETSTSIIPDCFIVESGERFWGGVTTAAELCRLDVQTLDVEEVVRCKDCRHFEHEFDGVGHCTYAGCHIDHMDSGFCSYGERKGGDGCGCK